VTVQLARLTAAQVAAICNEPALDVAEVLPPPPPVEPAPYGAESYSPTFTRAELEELRAARAANAGQVVVESAAVLARAAEIKAALPVPPPPPDQPAPRRRKRR
jgi:hypothetical protein